MVARVAFSIFGLQVSHSFRWSANLADCIMSNQRKALQCSTRHAEAILWMTLDVGGPFQPQKQGGDFENARFCDTASYCSLGEGIRRVRLLASRINTRREVGACRRREVEQGSSLACIRITLLGLATRQFSSRNFLLPRPNRRGPIFWWCHVIMNIND